MATEEILMAGVRGGGDRQGLHEIIRRHSQAAAKQVKELGQPNDLLKRLATEPALMGVDLTSVLDPARYVGRAPQQVERFVKEVIDPIRHSYRTYLSQDIDLRV
jgi:adenylosuccinate lyase